MGNEIVDWAKGENAGAATLDPAQEEVITGAGPSILDWATGANNDARPALDAVKDQSPDDAARNKRLSEQTGIPPEGVALDPEAVQQSVDRQEIQNLLRTAPVTNAFLSNPENAALAHDDVEQLSIVENIAAQVGQRFFNLASGANRIADFVIGRPLDVVAEMLERSIPLGTPEFDFSGDSPVVSVRPLTEEEIAAPSIFLQAARVQEGVDFGGTPITTWEEVKDEPLANFLPFALEQGIVSTPDMIGVMLNLPAYVIARSGEIGQTRALNNGKTDATVEDFVAAAPAAVASAVLERFGTRAILGLGDEIATGLAGIAKEVGKAAIKEALTEAGQEGIELVGETAGTEAGLPPIAEQLDRIAAGAVGGLGFGGTIRTVTASVQAATQAIKTREVADDLNEALGESALAERSPETSALHTAEALRKNGVAEVFIPALELDQVAEATGDKRAFYKALGVDADIQDALVLNGDVRVTGENFALHILGTDMYGQLKDNIRYVEDGMTGAEGKEFLSSGIQEEVEALGPDVTEVPLAPEPSKMKTSDVELDDAGPFQEPTAKVTSNPTVSTLTRIAKSAQDNVVRGWVDAAGNTHVWDGGVAIHEQLREQLGGKDLFNISLDAQGQPQLMTAFDGDPAVMDKLLGKEVSRDTTPEAQAADEAVTLAEQDLGLLQLFRSAEEAGLLPKAYSSYLVAVQSASEASRKRQEDKILKQAQRENTAAWQKERQAVEADVQEELIVQPVYAAVADIGRERLNREASDVILADAGLTVANLPTQARNRSIVASVGEKGTLDPDTYAQLYDYENAAEMFSDMATSPAFLDAVDTQTDRLMNERHGSLLEERQAILEARKSLHQDENAKVLEIELNTLRQSRGEGRLSRKLIKLAARKRLQSYPIDKIRPDQFVNASRRLGKQAGKLLRKGDRAGAADMKFRQTLNFHMALEAFKIRDRVNKQRKFMAKFTKQKKKFPTLPVPSLDAIRQILDQHSLGSRLAGFKRKDLIKWAENEATTSGAPFKVPERIVAEDAVTNYQDMTLEDFTELHRVVKEIHHRGVTENKMRRETEKQARNEIAAEVVEAIQTNLKQRGRVLETRSFSHKAIRNVRAAITLGLNIGTITREIDGFTNLGVTFRNIAGRYGQAISEGYREDQVGYTRRTQKEAKALTTIFDKFFTKKERLKFRKKLNVPGVDIPISQNAVLSVLLNSGNEDNRAAMVEGEQFTEEEIAAIHKFASKKDWEFTQAVWDYLETFWPEVKTATERRTNSSPEQVEAQEVKTEHGTFRGGYYPLRYDSGQSIVTTPQSTDVLRDQARFGTFVSSHTKRTHTENRVGSGGRKVLLDPSVIFTHVDQVIYDLEVGDAITDTYKILHHKDVKSAFADQGHLEKWEMMDLWLAGTITGEIRTNDVVENSLRWLRTGFTVSKLGWNVSVALLQPLGIIQSSVQIGRANIAKGMFAVLSSKQIGEGNIYEFVSEQTGFMASREESFNKDIIDAQRLLSSHLLDKFTPGKSADLLRSSFFYMIKKAQRFTDTVTWLGAKSAGMQMFEDEAKANTFADNMVARTQASGIFGDRTLFEQGTTSPTKQQTETVRVWTALISYFMAKTNVAYERTKKTNFKNPASVINYAVDMTMLYMVEAILAGAIRGAWPGEEDEEEVPEFVLRETISAVAGGVPVVREFWSEAIGFRGGGVFASAVEAFGRVTEQSSQGELDEAFLRASNNFLGMMLHYPSSQTNKTGSAIAAAQRGEDVDVLDFIFGPDFEK